MITKQALHYIILAALVITAPVHAMGVFAAARARISNSLTELSELGAYCKFMCTRKKNKPGAYELHPQSYGRHKEEEALLKEAGIDKTIFDSNRRSHSWVDDRVQVANEFHKAIIEFKHHLAKRNDYNAERWLCTALLIMRLNGSQEWPYEKSPVELAIQENIDKEMLAIIWRQDAAINNDLSGAQFNQDDAIKQFDDSRRKVHKKKQQAITQEIYNTPSMSKVAKPLINIMGEYAAEYPLMLTSPLEGHEHLSFVGEFPTLCTKNSNPGLSADAACHTPIASA